MTINISQLQQMVSSKSTHCINSIEVNYVEPFRLAHRRLGIFSEKMAGEERPLLTTAQISTHNAPSDCWVVIDNQVWDMTDFAPDHPGGADSRPS